jgi:leucyl-tRNA synthetase
MIGSVKRYEPKDIESKWQSVWEKTGIFQMPTKPSQKSYTLDMFPYPSGDGLHVGHPRGYTATDAYAHFKRFTGHDVLHPIGFDAFGLPAENAAIKKGIHPAQNTAANIENFTRQLKSLGFSYDWKRTVTTSDPDFYKWTQWIFTELFKAGLAYQAEGMQWWCPQDKTVLANEQVIDGKCERCGHEVTKKSLKHWFFKITDYADELLDALDDLDWPEPIKAMQRNWIGRSYGAEVTFGTGVSDLPVYTTRPDTIFGVTYLVLAPEHPLVEKVTTKERLTAVRKYADAAAKKTEVDRTAEGKEKTGVFTGAMATNPANGEEVPIWIADYVLANYGTGAIMAVPAHDQRDFDFAKKYDLPIKPVIMPETGEPQAGEEQRQSIVAVVENTQGELLTIDWGKRGGRMFVGGGRESGESPEETARREIAEETGYTDVELVEDGGPAMNHYVSIAKGINRCATAQLLKFRLRSEARTEPTLEAHEEGMFKVEWLGREAAATEIVEPMHALACQRLVEQVVYTGDGVVIDSGDYSDGQSSQVREQIVSDLASTKKATAKTGYKLRDWLISRQRYWGTPIPIIHCATCGPQPVPEDQLPVELPEIEDYLPTGDGRSPLAKVTEFVETVCPKCRRQANRETDTMDTFADSSWYFLRYPTPHKKTAAWDTKAVAEWLPVDMYVGGAEHAVLHLMYARFWVKALRDGGHLKLDEPFRTLKNVGMIHATDGQKMSKSKGNVINPDELVEAFGADTVRVFEMFIGPFSQGAAWSTEGIEGSYRFLKRVWAFGQGLVDATPKAGTTGSIDLTAGEAALSRGIRQVTRSLEQFRFNTAISALMETLNEFYALDPAQSQGELAAWQDLFARYLVLLAPFAPHLAEELWHQLSQEETIFQAKWPEVDADLLIDETVAVVVQVNGKVRTTLDLPADGLTEETVTAAALADATVAKQVTKQTLKRAIYVPGKLLNLVV